MAPPADSAAGSADVSSPVQRAARAARGRAANDGRVADADVRAGSDAQRPADSPGLWSWPPFGSFNFKDPVQVGIAVAAVVIAVVVVVMFASLIFGGFRSRRRLWIR
jgi:hypothetical protein